MKCKCEDCEYNDPVYFHDEETGLYYKYKPFQILLCLKHNRFVLDGRLMDDDS